MFLGIFESGWIFPGRSLVPRILFILGDSLHGTSWFCSWIRRGVQPPTKCSTLQSPSLRCIKIVDGIFPWNHYQVIFSCPIFSDVRKCGAPGMIYLLLNQSGFSKLCPALIMGGFGWTWVDSPVPAEMPRGTNTTWSLLLLPKLRWRKTLRWSQMREEMLEGVFGADLLTGSLRPSKNELYGRNICYIYMIHDNYMMYDMMMNTLYFSTLPFSSTNPYSLIGYHLCWGQDRSNSPFIVRPVASGRRARATREKL